MRVALCQLNSVVGDPAGNLARLLDWYGRAQGFGAELVVFPEMALTGYPPRDLLELDEFLEASDAATAAAVEKSGKAGLLFGAPRRNPGAEGKHLFNAAVLCAEGATVAEVRKKLLPTYDVFDEARYFEPDAEPARPVTFRGIRWGIHVCEDAWNEEGFWERRLYRRDPVAELVSAGAEILLNVSASPFHATKDSFRRAMFGSHARRHGVPLLYTNAVGGNDELIFDGMAFAFTGDGRAVAEGAPFEEEILVVEVAPHAARAIGSWIPGTSGADPDPVPARPEPEPIESIRRALVLGLRDYARKCGFRDTVLGLSGGIDSAVTAALAAEALGPEHVWGVSLPSRYSSAGSLDDARALADALGIRYSVLSIEPVFQGSLDALAEPFAGTTPGLAEENLQARARGLLLMALSNKFGHLLLTTGNKSELAVGYCTLYGDMAGGLAVISDLPKGLVYELAHRINRDRAVIPGSTLTKPPSAELRPGQRDEDSLPPYALLDRILEGHVEQRLGRYALAAKGLPTDLVGNIISMVARAEYKRRQAPPGLRISPKAFGSGRRMPIATPWPTGRKPGAISSE